MTRKACRRDPHAGAEHAKVVGGGADPRIKSGDDHDTRGPCSPMIPGHDVKVAHQLTRLVLDVA
jgi:hypothetical protein